MEFSSFAEFKEWLKKTKKEAAKNQSKIEVIEEEKDNFKPVISPLEIIGKLMLKLDKYKHQLTSGQYQQCLSIWQYDPYSAIRYCKSMIAFKKKKDKDIYVE